MTDNTQADSYYDESAQSPAEDFDLSFLDDTSSEK
jgi:hypothetical protein